MRPRASTATRVPSLSMSLARMRGGKTALLRRTLLLRAMLRMKMMKGVRKTSSSPTLPEPWSSASATIRPCKMTSTTRLSSMRRRMRASRTTVRTTTMMMVTPMMRTERRVIMRRWRRAMTRITRRRRKTTMKGEEARDENQAKVAKEARGLREAGVARDLRKAKVAKQARGLREAKVAKEARDLREAKEARDLHEAKVAKGVSRASQVNLAKAAVGRTRLIFLSASQLCQTMFGTRPTTADARAELGTRASSSGSTRRGRREADHPSGSGISR
mmetsp:Transcript_16796/g.47669  ORF Transcript_16796/g.47669 Transcript_16796/m.47669 type:complete len:274 (-) Transcript_16796:288-1109(-)